MVAATVVAQGSLSVVLDMAGDRALAPWGQPVVERVFPAGRTWFDPITPALSPFPSNADGTNSTYTNALLLATSRGREFVRTSHV